MRFLILFARAVRRSVVRSKIEFGWSGSGSIEGNHVTAILGLMLLRYILIDGNSCPSRLNRSVERSKTYFNTYSIVGDIFL